MSKGYVHIFTGDGKGKTTAALGIAVRAIGAGVNVFIGQFLKNEEYSEIKAFKKFTDIITIEQFGTGKFVNGKPTPEEFEASRKGLERVKFIIKENKYKMIILDEANVAVKFGLLSSEDIIEVVKSKSYDTELIITGRGASQNLLDYADNVTEMISKKHYFEKGVSARVGIEK